MLLPIKRLLFLKIAHNPKIIDECNEMLVAFLSLKTIFQKLM